MVVWHYGSAVLFQGCECNGGAGSKACVVEHELYVSIEAVAARQFFDFSK